ncbi:MAG: hypothetical protein IT328_16205 [Caldilineaceae bacterium]|nr:hypothetical protein [Caldilineaceae bacterium]
MMERFIDQTVEPEAPLPWLWRILMAVEAWSRPVWGWGVLVTCMLLPLLPATALRAHRRLDLDTFQSTLEVAGPLAVAAVWLLWGWRRQERRHFGWLAVAGALLIGVVALSQLLLGWIPGPRAIWQAIQSGGWIDLLFASRDAWMRAFIRFALWQQGVASGGAAQDNLVFAAFASAIFWILGLLTGWLARAVRQGFAAAAPSLWLLGAILLYSNGGRYLLLTGLVLMLALHILLEQGVLMNRWQQLDLDYSPGLLTDRFLAVVSAGAIVLTLAAVMPNLYIEPLVMRYYEILAPVHRAMEETGERLFPELRGVSRLRGGSGSGMPNEFLLQGGPNQGTTVVMRVRTDEAPATYQMPFDEMVAPPGHYMRGGTLTVYDGHGWRNPSDVTQQDVPANRRWDGASPWGRKPVVQSVIMEVSTSTLYAAPEPVEVSTDTRLAMRSDDDQVTLYAREPSYTVVSLVPALDESMLRALPSWVGVGEVATESGVPLPEAMALHLSLPETVTERTRELAAQLVTGQETAYDKALAIEQYLRQYTYDLEVSEPPEDIADVADYFLFELQRGYCDYYATAFVVLARLAGLPTRFATGFAVGQWNPVDGVWVITESEAHSWPEVYFPEAGWVAFEPTAGRASLVRTALPQTSRSTSPPPIVPAAAAERQEPKWNWQQLVWLVLLLGLIWAAVLAWQWWRRRREDPWHAVLQWGSRVGRPMDAGETVLEYGEGLAGYVVQHPSKTPDAGRIAAREIQAVSVEVNRVHYGRVDERSSAKRALEEHWRRLRSYLPLVRFHR